MNAPPQAIAPNPHTNLLNVRVYVQIANKMVFQPKKKKKENTTRIETAVMGLEQT
jgi:hypothetical protein